MYEGWYDIRDKNLPTVLANSSNDNRAHCHDMEWKQHVRSWVNIIFCPSKANTWKFKTYLAIEMSQNNTLINYNTWQIIEVSNLGKRHADNSRNHVELWPLKICQSITFLPITQDEVPFINLHKHEWSNKKVEWLNRERQMYKCHKP